MELTKLTALQKTAKMWDWLTEHPQCDKEDYFREMNVRLDPAAGCYCCEYTEQQNSASCEFCPLLGYWTRDERSQCEEKASPFYKWERSKRDSTRAKHAKQVADLARRAIADLNKQKEK